MELTRENSMQTWGLLNSLAGAKTSAKGAYGIAKNRRILEIEKDSIQQAQISQQAELSVFAEDLKKFDEARVELCKEYADKDEDGKPITSNNQFKLVQRNAEFLEAFAKLRAEERFAKPLKTRDDLDKKFQEFMKETIEVDLHAIKVDDLPNDMTAQQMDILGELIVE